MRRLTDKELNWIEVVWPDSQHEVYDVLDLVAEVKASRAVIQPLYQYIQNELAMGGPILELLKSCEHMIKDGFSDEAAAEISRLDEESQHA